ncbi:hypothetical protein Cst_c08060 [Thermoclostridium stercorarium subsp. stercorarium DSM 8532]|uniref:Uncharacterized protein n=2 Tax=Thermoclostridium stercorarium TaxID=1510 RepID=L7VQG7_THES1|nr:hypothetical protein [Thermoclostridium stercorarium]AGC67808.1 hypothetical protein Cst_c08060 [Thermoclostridium stercorarium subsp. stercorarium DSM 8532]AGI38851.1 hypothetical protein Clst_0770 [Thermoclostridium stercorarium subsp. stercorarium DSM 8532]ANW98209.1 hypothetical protein CSTERTH_03735 [Thermoclostridium stercorarium subsp. thermolacticum DSM 2910]
MLIHRNLRENTVIMFFPCFTATGLSRVGAVRNGKDRVPEVKNIWHEDDFMPAEEVREEIAGCFNRFADFNECKNVIYYTKY